MGTVSFGFLVWQIAKKPGSHSVWGESSEAFGFVSIYLAVTFDEGSFA
jgi:hypothetical protein